MNSNSDILSKIYPKQTSLFMNYYIFKIIYLLEILGEKSHFKILDTVKITETYNYG